jgi:hypothetical protein
MKMWLEFSDSLCVPLSSHILHFCGFIKTKTMGGADRGAGGFEASVNPFHAVVTLDHLSGLGIPLGSPPWAGGHAALAAHAQRRVHKDDAVLWPFLHGPSGAGDDTPGILTVKAGHEHIGCARLTLDESGTHGDDVRGLWVCGKVLVGLAGHLAAAASDAFLFILIEIVNAHCFPPTRTTCAPDLSDQGLERFVILRRDSNTAFSIREETKERARSAFSRRAGPRSHP